jgi:CheY-like chemotaxis protein
MARQLREDPRYTAIPIIVATADAYALDAEWRIRDIGVPILLKPFTIGELERHIEAGQEGEAAS